MHNLVEEIKSAIREKYTYYEASSSSHPGDYYLDETLILENEKILYYAKRMGNDEIEEGSCVIYSNTKEFLKAPVDEIIKTINMAYFYNVQ